MKENTLPKLLKRVATEYPDFVAQYYKDKNKFFVSNSYIEVYNSVLNVASGLLKLGGARGDRIGLIADNRPEWLLSSFGIMTIGAADVPRGCDATELELVHILSFSECKIAIVENENQVKKILKNIESFPVLKKLIVIDDFDFSTIDSKNIQLISFKDVVEDGKKFIDETKPETELLKGSEDEIATVIFTSGTTGIPKGVMLIHNNFLSQIDELSVRIPLTPGQKGLSVLPVWHSFERLCEYIIINGVSAISYSKPIASVLLKDLETIEPAVFPSVPRIWEGVYDAIIKMMKKTGGITNTIFKVSLSIGQVWKTNQLKLIGRMSKFSKMDYILHPLSSILPTVFLFPLYKLADILVFKKIRAKMGRNFNLVGGVSGGGALPKNVDMFFSTVGIKVLEGYGITETAPVISVRPSQKPVFGNVGKPLMCLEARIVDKQGNILPAGQKGAIHIKGPTVMKGYYKNVEKTNEVIDKDGWFDTGDLGKMTIDGELVITGRKKDTIVLRGGENLEPIPIEMKLQESQYIKTAVLLGQDQRYLAALILIDETSLKMWAEEKNIDASDLASLVAQKDVIDLYDKEIQSLISSQNGFKLFERISAYKLLTTNFEQGRELSAKGEVMRHKINKIYESEIAELFTK